MLTATKKIFPLLVLMAGLQLPRPALAQNQPQNQEQQVTKTTWTLQECVEHALKNNLRIKQTQLDARLTNINLKGSQANMLPSVNGSTNYGFNFGRSIDPTENTFINQQIQSASFSVSASVPIFNGFQIQNTIKQNRINKEAAETDILTAQNDIALNVAAAYLQIIFSDALLENARVQLSSSQQQAERTQKLFRAGSVAGSNVLEIEAQVATDELAIINAQNQKDIAELNLMQLLDLKKVTDFEVVRPDIKDPGQEIINFDPEEIYGLAQQNMPQVRSAELRVNSALKGIDISKGAYLPRLAIGGNLNTQYSSARSLFLGTNTFVPQPLGFTDAAGTQPFLVYVPGRVSQKYPFLDQLTDNQGKSLFLSLNIPILNGLQVRNNVARSVLNHESAVLNTEIVRNQLRQNIQQAYADALAAQKKFTATRRQLEALEQTFKNAEIRFNNGVLNPTEFNVARNNFIRAQTDLIQAKYDYTFRLKVLDFYQGKPLSL
ncbi:TolC family protein [Adhaeribacter rhizoryzae]|uniref:TolC family protein n=1 Tax=Adhaeribacter rhizoryzae TaxID=2607907 RepID=A0A5M6DJZ6_9BACT|nr:TolC family protein [Adhaeribacter rhizoryzae]KAA5547874.1 TolC family protein [Adhaeribacter rhizoryzae]